MKQQLFTNQSSQSPQATDTNCTTKTTTPMVSISSVIGNLRGGAAEYYLARHHDSKDAIGSKAGSGWAQFSLTKAAQHLNKTPATVRKNLYQGLHNGFFWNVKIKGDNVLVRYKSEARIAFEQGKEHLGSFGRIPLERLTHLSIAATEVQTEALQRSSVIAATRHTKQEDTDEKRQVTPIDKLFADSRQKQCQNWGAETHIIYQGPRCTFVSRDFLPYGVSQERVAEHLEVSDRTVRSRLSRLKQEAIGKQIQKTQLAVKTDDSPRNWKTVFNALTIEGAHMSAKEMIRNYNYGKAVFQLSTNVYNFDDIEMIKQGWKKKDLKKRIKEEEKAVGIDVGIVETKEKETKEAEERTNKSKPEAEGRNRKPSDRSTKEEVVTENFSSAQESISTSNSGESLFKPGDMVVIQMPGTRFHGMKQTIRGITYDALDRQVYELDFLLGGAWHLLPGTALQLVHSEPDEPRAVEGTAIPTELIVSGDDIRALEIPKSHWLNALFGKGHRIRQEEVKPKIWQQLLHRMTGHKLTEANMMQ
ncbi:MAG: hypothetical protein ACTS2F_25370 [Thainema sp.]